MHLQCVYIILAKSYRFLFIEGAHIKQNDCIWCVENLKVLYCQYDLGVKVKVTHTSNFYTAHDANSSFIFLTEGVYILHNNCIWCVNKNTGLKIQVSP